MKRFLFSLLLLTGTLEAQQLVISDGGRRIVDHDSTSATANCQAVTAGPMPVLDDIGDVSLMYTVGGWFVDWCEKPFMSPDRFGDRIWVHARRYGDTWSSPDMTSNDSGRIAIDRSSFPWMSDYHYLVENPEAHVGHVASPSVVKRGGKYYMAFTASLDDWNLCAAEHSDIATTCGSCSDPWSYFVMMWATSDDGIHWRVRDPIKTTQRNRALGASVLRMLPRTEDRTKGSKFKGISNVSMLLGADPEDDDKVYFYLAVRIWSRTVIRPLLIRIPFDPATEEGLGGDPQIYNANAAKWENCPTGDIPRWVLDVGARSLTTFGWPATVAWTNVVPGYRAIALFVTDSGESSLPAARGLQNSISYQLSNDLVEWSKPVTVRSAVPLFADGKAYDHSVFDPIYVEDKFGKARIYFASADGDPLAGLARDGRYDCQLGDFSTAIYVGTGIYEAVLDFRQLYETETILTTSANPAKPGEKIRLTARVTSKAPVWATGHIVFREGITDLARVPVVNGRAEFDVAFPTPSIRILTAEFIGEGLFAHSKSQRKVQLILTRRRGASRG